jgi:SPP1 gp7 family putative phage head morphogenesis protein
MTTLTQPLSFDAANEWLKKRISVPTFMNSKQLALSKEFSSKVKAHSFYSAKVAEKSVLEQLRDINDRYSAGKINLAEARAEAKEFLSGKGYTADDVTSQSQAPAGISQEKWEEAKQITNIASKARLNLIFNQNAAMADAVGQWEVSMDADIKERWPYFRYITGPNPRPEHAALDGLVLSKDDPFWHTHTPPWDYNCNCTIEDCDEEEARQYGGISKVVRSGNSFKIDNNGRFVNIEEPESGFVFDIREAFTIKQDAA